MSTDLPLTLKKISGLLKIQINKHDLPDRATIAGTDGRWVKTHSEWRAEFPQDLLEKFNEENKAVLRKLGYL